MENSLQQTFDLDLNFDVDFVEPQIKVLFINKLDTA